MNGAQAVVAALKQQDVRTVFGYPGGCIMPVYDALLDVGDALQHILCRHEQACALAADGYARASGRVGVCLATSGPGATNLITGVANAFMDSIPMVVLTGQVPTGLIGTDAFQETDILGMTLGIVKHSYLVTSADSIPGIMAEAFRLARSGRPGPVWIDLPKDVLLQSLSPAVHQPEQANKATTEPELALDAPEATWQTATQVLIGRAEKPLVYFGGGVVAAGAVTALRGWLAQEALPSVCTLKGIGVAAKSDVRHLGMLGMHGSRAANEAVEECDLLIALGVRFDDRATGKVSQFARNARIIHVDCDAAELNKLRAVDLGIQAPLTQALDRMAGFKPSAEWARRIATLKQLKGFQVAANLEQEISSITGPRFISALSRLAPAGTVLACDVGQHQMWVAQHFAFDSPACHLSSSGLGTMGYGLPAAIGAQLSNPEAVVVNVSGDGSFMMNLQELATIRRYRLPVKIIVLDNQYLGMVRQQQELFYKRRYSEVDLSDNPEFTEVARAFGMNTLKITRSNEIRRGIETLFAYPGAMLLHVLIEQEDNVWPIVAPGSANRDMIDPIQSERKTQRQGAKK